MKINIEYIPVIFAVLIVGGSYLGKWFLKDDIERYGAITLFGKTYQVSE